MSGRGSGPREWRSMKQSSCAWSRAYARQAQADLEAREALLDATVPACQHLHFLQMACEKISKAHQCLGGADPETPGSRGLRTLASRRLPVLTRSDRGIQEIVMVALPTFPPAFAWMVAVPRPLAGAVYRPVLLIDPRPLSFDHVKLGWIAMAWANWSSALAENCCGAWNGSVTDDGVTRPSHSPCSSL